MVHQEQIREICGTMVREFHPQRIILFGSYARGTAGAGSGVDLLVIMPAEGSTLRQTARLYQAIKDRTVAVDLVVRTPADIAERLRDRDPFISGIMREGKVLHGDDLSPRNP